MNLKKVALIVKVCQWYKYEFKICSFCVIKLYNGI